jgi:hypothetical protein
MASRATVSPRGGAGEQFQGMVELGMMKLVHARSAISGPRSWRTSFAAASSSQKANSCLHAADRRASISARRAFRFRHRRSVMPYSRGSFFLTPPTVPVFAISLIIAIAALLVRYAGIAVPLIDRARVFDVLAIAYVILVAGVVIRRL